jgi:hypothetical protein
MSEDLTRLTADALIERLQLSPHPEGGHYRETWRGPAGPEGRSIGTAIVFLLKGTEVSHWHRVDATEIWFWHGGAPLELRIAEGDRLQVMRLGSDVARGECLQGIVPEQAWQSARSCGDYSLVSCTVTPGFEFSGFVLAPPNFTPTARERPD